MSKELCFNIENENLYLEQVLVDYMDIPIYFLCKGKKEYYIVLCTNIDEFSYVVTKISLLDTYNLLHGKIPMRDVILKQKEYWEIISGDEIELDLVTKYAMCNLEISVLPEENAFFKVLTKTIELFIQQFDNEYFSTKYFTESDKKAELSNVIEDNLFDALMGNINQFTELADCKIEKTMVSPIGLYNETMRTIKTEEGSFNNKINSCEVELNETSETTLAIAA